MIKQIPQFRVVLAISISLAISYMALGFAQELENISNNTFAVSTHAFVDAYGEKSLNELSYSNFRFSPDERLLAFAVSGIESGDPEQVWIYDIETQKLRLATEKIKKNEVGFSLKEMKWENNGTLVIDMHRIDWKNQSNNQEIRIRATMEMSENEIMKPNSDNKNNTILSPSQRYGIRSSPPQTTLLMDLKNHGNVLAEYSNVWDAVQWGPSDGYFVFRNGLGHGSFELNVGYTQKPFKVEKIPEGSEVFALHPKKRLVAFAVTEYQKPFQVSIYSVKDKRIIRRLATGPYPRCQAWSSNYLVVTMNGRAPIVQGPGRIADGSNPSVPRNICLIKILN